MATPPARPREFCTMKPRSRKKTDDREGVRATLPHTARTGRTSGPCPRHSDAWRPAIELGKWSPPPVPHADRPPLAFRCLIVRLETRDRTDSRPIGQRPIGNTGRQRVSGAGNEPACNARLAEQIAVRTTSRSSCLSAASSPELRPLRLFSVRSGGAAASCGLPPHSSRRRALS